jgi:hypothetical protein
MVAYRAPDFAVFYASATAVLRHVDPYAAPDVSGANLNPPGFILCLAPLGWLSYGHALAAWCALSALALWWSVRATARATNLPILLLLVATIGHQGGGMAIRVGELTFLLMPLFVLAWLADRDGREWTAGVFMGALLYLKLFLGLFLVYWLWRGATRAVTACAAVVIGLWLLTVIVLGVDPLLSWIGALRGISWQVHPVNGSLSALAARSFHDFSGLMLPVHFRPVIEAPLLEWGAGLAMRLAVAWLSAMRLPRLTRDGQWTLCLLTALLLSPLGWTYYLPWIAGPALLTIGHRPLLVALACLLPPWAVFTSISGPLPTLLVGSCATWALLALWVGCLTPGSAQP